MFLAFACKLLNSIAYRYDVRKTLLAHDLKLEGPLFSPTHEKREGAVGKPYNEPL